MLPTKQQPGLDCNTFDLGNVILQRRQGVSFKIQGPLNSETYLAENQIKSEFHKLGRNEYLFLSLLDGHKTVADAQTVLNSHLPDEEINDAAMASMAYWAVQCGIAEPIDRFTPSDFADTSSTIRPNNRTWFASSDLDKRSNSPGSGHINPLVFRIPLGNPDRVIRRLLPFVQPLLNFWAASLWAILIVSGALICIVNCRTMFLDRFHSFSATDAVWIVFTWIVLKVVHELAHAIASRSYGHELGRSGILFVLFMPMPYVDVTSIWREEDKWRRISVSFAGIGAELLIASLAAGYWLIESPGPIRYHLENIILVAGIQSVLVNANPLMRFDGYYMLSDWLEISNLHQKGRKASQNFIRWAAFGTPIDPPQERILEKKIIVAYGLFSYAWSILLTLGLIVGAFSLSEGIGLVLATSGIVIWVIAPLTKWCMALFKRGNSAKEWNFQAVARACGIAMTIVLLATYLPAPATIRAPAVFDLANREEVFVQEAGIVEHLFVVDGQHVQKGQLIAKLKSIELEHELTSTALKIEQSKLRKLRALSGENIPDFQLESLALSNLEARLQSLSKRTEMLEVRAPMTGIVLTTSVANLQGKYLQSGSPLIQLGELESLQCVALVDQNDSKWLDATNTLVGRLTIDGEWGDNFNVRMKLIKPRASDYLPHFAFASNFGGRLSTLTRGQIEGKESGHDFGATDREPLSASSVASNGMIVDAKTASYRSLMLTQPYVQIVLECEEDDFSRKVFYPGQTGVVHLHEREESLGRYLADIVYRSIRGKLRYNHGM